VKPRLCFITSCQDSFLSDTVITAHAGHTTNKGAVSKRRDHQRLIQPQFLWKNNLKIAQDAGAFNPAADNNRLTVSDSPGSSVKSRIVLRDSTASYS
jgi:hypothetical protein